MIAPDLDLVLPDTLGRLHFVGIGGSGMSGIARMFHARGHVVTGSDRSESPTVEALRALGIPVAIGHDAAHVGDAEALVVNITVPQLDTTSDAEGETDEAAESGDSE